VYRLEEVWGGPRLAGAAAAEKGGLRQAGHSGEHPERGATRALIWTCAEYMYVVRRRKEGKRGIRRRSEEQARQSAGDAMIGRPPAHHMPGQLPHTSRRRCWGGVARGGAGRWWTPARREWMSAGREGRGDDNRGREGKGAAASRAPATPSAHRVARARGSGWTVSHLPACCGHGSICRSVVGPRRGPVLRAQLFI
jgi:hypothetical protein